LPPLHDPADNYLLFYRRQRLQSHAMMKTSIVLVCAHLWILCFWPCCCRAAAPLGAACPVNQGVMQERLRTRHQCGLVVTQHLHAAAVPRICQGPAVLWRTHFSQSLCVN
jgi:hypothetical protein